MEGVVTAHHLDQGSLERDVSGPKLLGTVVIGRNEGERLVRCLTSVMAQSPRVIYVDSGSSDDSVAQAQRLGAEVVLLDLNSPFTAARARNVGFAHLLQCFPETDYVQFVDGDCTLAADWIERALAVLEERPQVAVVCGRRRERFPEVSVFNQLCDLEWNTPVGEALACGGDALMRVTALQQNGGFNPGLIAGEEPELCLRLRQQGWKVFRIEADMTVHDAQMLYFSQWWKRAVRGGHAYAEVSWIHRHDTEPLWRRESLRIWGWGLALPLLIVLLGLVVPQWSVVLGLAYPLLILKTYLQASSRYDQRSNLLYSVFCTLIKFPELQGQMIFHRNRLQGNHSRLIEYKANLET
jgi:GT2 family glycosyltransferase